MPPSNNGTGAIGSYKVLRGTTCRRRGGHAHRDARGNADFVQSTGPLTNGTTYYYKVVGIHDDLRRREHVERAGRRSVRARRCLPHADDLGRASRVDGDVPGPTPGARRCGNVSACGRVERQRHLRLRARRRQPPLLAAGAQRESYGLERVRRGDHVRPDRAGRRHEHLGLRPRRRQRRVPTVDGGARPAGLDARSGGGADLERGGRGKRHDDLRLRTRRRTTRCTRSGS